jgi:hypothetical protein
VPSIVSLIGLDTEIELMELIGRNPLRLLLARVAVSFDLGIARHPIRPPRDPHTESTTSLTCADDSLTQPCQTSMSPPSRKSGLDIMFSIIYSSWSRPQRSQTHDCFCTME